MCIRDRFQLDQEDKDNNFTTTDTSNTTINNYFETAHYLDQSIKEFFDYLKKSGLDKNTMVILYGDHYGVGSSDDELSALAPVLGKDFNKWTSYDTAELQKVPFMIHMDGIKGKVDNKISGEIDVLPTLLHLLGISNKNYIQFGQDLFSKQYRQVVVFRNGTIITPKYVIIGGKGTKGTVYNQQTGEKITKFNKKQKDEINKLTSYGRTSLHYSDLLNNHNLLRFYTPAGFIPTNPTEFDYKVNYQKMLTLRKQLGNKSTSLYSQHKGSTTDLYDTDASEIDKDEINKVPENIQSATSDKSKSHQDNAPKKDNLEK